MIARKGDVRPAGSRPDARPTVTRSYCRRDGWLCTPDGRCDEHQPDRDPVRLGDILAGGGE